MAVNSRTLLIAGCGHDGRLGLGANESNHPAFIRHPFFKKHNLVIVSIHVGGYHTFVRTTTGVYGFGVNEDGQLGIGEKTPSIRTPTLVPFFGDGTALVDIACGAYHTVAWMLDGVYSCGGNAHGQLGQQDYEGRMHFTRIATINAVEPVADSDSGHHSVPPPSQLPVTHISCGTYHTLIGLKDIVVSRSVEGGSGGEEAAFMYPVAVVACGKGDFGELGYDAEHWDVMAAKEKRLKASVSARSHHVAQGGSAGAFASSAAVTGGNDGTSAGVYGTSDDADAQLQSDSNGAMSAGMPVLKMKPKPKFAMKVKPRRAEFSHPTLKPICMPLLDDQAVRITPAAALSGGHPALMEHGASGDGAGRWRGPPGKDVATVKRIALLKAAHLHSILHLEVERSQQQPTSRLQHAVGDANQTSTLEVLPDDTPVTAAPTALSLSKIQSYHFGCYYCNGVEGDESSVPVLDAERPAGDASTGGGGGGGLVFHAGNEVCIGACALNSPDLPLGAAAGPLLVKGKGALGLQDEDSYEPEWKVLPIPAPAAAAAAAAGTTEEIRKVSGRDHFLVWLRRRSGGGSTTSGSNGGRPSSASASTFRDAVYCFGDNLMGQLGLSSADDMGLAPAMVLESLGGGGAPSCATAVPGVAIVRVLDVACGARHSLILVEEAA